MRFALPQYILVPIYNCDLKKKKKAKRNKIIPWLLRTGSSRLKGT